MRAWKGLVLGLLLGSVAAGSVLVSAQQDPGKPSDPFQNLGLSTEQRSKLDTLTNERKAALTASQQKITGLRQKLRELLFDKKASDKEIDKTADLMAKADREALLKEVKFHKTMRQILTQEQLTSLMKGNK